MKKISLLLFLLLTIINFGVEKTPYVTFFGLGYAAWEDAMLGNSFSSSSIEYSVLIPNLSDRIGLGIHVFYSIGYKKDLFDDNLVWVSSIGGFGISTNIDLGYIGGIMKKSYLELGITGALDGIYGFLLGMNGPFNNKYSFGFRGFYSFDMDKYMSTTLSFGINF
ncbi:hypothetical protein SAMN02745164_00262 [Marinitoga hydrogenitolerans DSM 16785]|uniref:Uncharacterized protein n=1 Tax=Marinitoga hydrogenitolerans (strain DSM 16785 / JCM 12826 / AT1271) TaxID=1122195 RepID=A0A1M4SQ83_MARH1|nr:hypothetical protein [Marinitoga hydrogenitolerans]SHE34370.1 hypothetical protein SAMN02745164_00262 [Marinitoga hydrogenitolerans DSM 16785]